MAHRVRKLFTFQQILSIGFVLVLCTFPVCQAHGQFEDFVYIGSARCEHIDAILTWLSKRHYQRFSTMEFGSATIEVRRKMALRARRDLAVHWGNRSGVYIESRAEVESRIKQQFRRHRHGRKLS